MGATRKTSGIGKSQLGKRHFPQCAGYTRPLIFSSLCVKIRPYSRLGMGHLHVLCASLFLRYLTYFCLPPSVTAGNYRHWPRLVPISDIVFCLSIMYDGPHIVSCDKIEVVIVIILYRKNTRWENITINASMRSRKLSTLHLGVNTSSSIVTQMTSRTTSSGGSSRLFLDTFS
jgi:hypothetical protein